MRRDRLGFLESVLLGIAFLMIILACASCGCAEKPKATTAIQSMTPAEKLAETIKKRLLDKDLDVRIAAAGAIVKMAEINAASSLSLVEHALKMSDEEIRMTVAWSFSTLAREVPESVDHIFELALNDSNPQVRYHLAHAMRFMSRISGVVRILMRLLDDPDRMVRFTADESRYFLRRGF